MEGHIEYIIGKDKPTAFMYFHLTLGRVFSRHFFSFIFYPVQNSYITHLRFFQDDRIDFLENLNANVRKNEFWSCKHVNESVFVHSGFRSSKLLRYVPGFAILQRIRLFHKLAWMKNCCQVLQTISQLANVSSFSRNSTNISSPIQYSPGERRILSNDSVILIYFI